MSALSQCPSLARNRFANWVTTQFIDGGDKERRRGSPPHRHHLNIATLCPTRRTAAPAAYLWQDHHFTVPLDQHGHVHIRHAFSGAAEDLKAEFVGRLFEGKLDIWYDFPHAETNTPLVVSFQFFERVVAICNRLNG